jgi:hypothetical protein
VTLDELPGASLSEPLTGHFTPVELLCLQLLAVVLAEVVR